MPCTYDAPSSSSLLGSAAAYSMPWCTSSSDSAPESRAASPSHSHHGWSLNDTQSDSSCASCSVHIDERPARKSLRGRPAGTTGTQEQRAALREWRKRYAAQELQQHQVLAGAGGRHDPPDARAATAGALVAAGTAQFLAHGFADTCLRTLASSACRKQIPSDTALTELVNHCFSKLPRGTSSTVRAEAAILKCSAKRLPQRLEVLAAACWTSTRLFIESIASHFEQAILKKQITPLAFAEIHFYDETPLPVRGKEKGCGHTPVTTKLLQCECIISLSYISNSTGEIAIVRVPVTTPVLAMETCSAETLYEALQSRLHIGTLTSKLKSLFASAFALSVCDSAKSNLRYEAFLFNTVTNEARTQFKLRVACEVHMMSRASTRAYTPIGADIAGLIAVALTCSLCGAARKLREAIKTIIKDISSRVYKKQPPHSPPPTQAPTNKNTNWASFTVMLNCFRFRNILTAEGSNT